MNLPLKTILLVVRSAGLMFVVGAFFAPLPCRAGLGDDFHKIQQELDDALLDVYSNAPAPTSTIAVSSVLDKLKPYVREAEAMRLLEFDVENLSTAGQIGKARARLEHVAALEMLRCQQAGDLSQALAWRTLVTLPQFASSVSGETLLQNSDPEQAKRPEVSQSLAREYLQWQTMRVRQLLDFLQEQVTQNTATQSVVDAYGAEIGALADFSSSLLQVGEVKAPGSLPAPIKWFGGTDPKRTADLVAAWRGDVEAGLPNLLTEKDIGRMQRLLVRFVKLVPREYENGVHNGQLIIPLEYREAAQFSEQAQTLVNQLAPIWKQEASETYRLYRPVLDEKLAGLRSMLAHYAAQEKIQDQGEPDFEDSRERIQNQRSSERGDRRCH